MSDKLSPGFKLGNFEMKVDDRGFGKVFIDGVEIQKVTRVEVIEIDGVRLRNIRSIHVHAAVNDVTTVKLELIALDGVEITGEVAKVEKKTVDAEIPIP